MNVMSLRWEEKEMKLIEEMARKERKKNPPMLFQLEKLFHHL